MPLNDRDPEERPLRRVLLAFVLGVVALAGPAIAPSAASGGDRSAPEPCHSAPEWG